MVATREPEPKLVMRGFEKSVRQARFMRAVRDLADDDEIELGCFDHLAEIAKELPPLDESTLEHELPLVRGWQRRWNLIDPWCRDFALAVLYDWRDDPDLLESRTLPDPDLLTIDPPPAVDYSHTPRPEWPVFKDGMKAGEYLKLLERLGRRYLRLCEREKARVTDPWRPEPALRPGNSGLEPDELEDRQYMRLCWLARYQCAGESVSAIAKSLEWTDTSATPDAVLQAVRRWASYIELSLRSPDRELRRTTTTTTIQ